MVKKGAKKAKEVQLIKKSNFSWMVGIVLIIIIAIVVLGVIKENKVVVKTGKVIGYDPCEGISCPKCQSCDPADGKCKPPGQYPCCKWNDCKKYPDTFVCCSQLKRVGGLRGRVLLAVAQEYVGVEDQKVRVVTIQLKMPVKKFIVIGDAHRHNNQSQSLRSKIY